MNEAMKKVVDEHWHVVYGEPNTHVSIGAGAQTAAILMLVAAVRELTQAMLYPRGKMS